MTLSNHCQSAGIALVCACFAGSALAQDTSVAPEMATGRADSQAIVTQNHMVAAANPLAVQAGADVLAAGGTAIDAMVAVQMVLNLVEPQSSGIGGGAFLVYFDASTNILTTLDGRETAPMAADESLFLDDNGEKLGFWDAVVGGRSVGTPGTLKLMETAHQRYGSMEWAGLLQPAIDLAQSGFSVSPRLAGMLANERVSERLQTFPTTRDYFYPNGAALVEGDLLTNQLFADTLTTIASEGSSAFYGGPIAQDIVATIQGAEGNPGLLSEEDLAAYEVIERDPVCADYRGRQVCGMGPPSSGALTVGQMLEMLESFDLASMGPNSVDSWHLFAEAGKLAYADRGLYMADSDFVSMPTEGLLDNAYLADRVALISLDTPMQTPAAAGEPPWKETQLYGAHDGLDLPGTSHVSIIDDQGNAVSLTTTIETGFGSQLMVRGFLLNNELTDFSFAPVDSEGRDVANRVQPGKRPRSSMSPTIVLDENGEIELVIGSPGGSRIINYVAQTIIGVLDWRLDVQAAIDLPHVTNRNGATDLEAGTAAEELAELLAERGHEVNIRDLNSGLHGIQVTEAGLLGGADPRREGTAAGQ